MARTISTKLAVEGESQYKQAIASCSSELSTLKSQLNLVETAYKGNANSLAALSEKGKTLQSMYEKQAEKVAVLETALKNCQAAQAQYAQRVSTARENISRCEQELERLKNSTEDTSEEQQALTEELGKWNAELEEAQAGQAAAERGVQNWQRQLNNANADLLNLDEELQRNRRYLEEAEESTDGCADSIDEFGNETEEASEGIEQLSAALASAGVAGEVKEIADTLRDCVDTFASFESQMSTVQAISGASGEELAALGEKAKYMGATTAFTATQSAEAFEYMAMAGWKTEEMLGGLEGIMYLAAASGEDLASTSDIVTDALTAFGLTASDSSHFADVLAAASSNANTNVGMMGETFKYAAPVAGALGYSVEDTALAIGLMANAGIKGSQAGTALRGMLTNLAKPSETVAGYMEALGVSLTDSAGNVRSLSDLMSILRERFSELSEAEQTEYAAGIAGKEAMSGLLAVVNASDADFQKLTRAINECNGAAYEMSQIQLDNYAGKVTLLGSAIDGLKMATGEQLTPALGRLVDAGTSAFTWAAEFVNQNPWIVGAVTGVTAAIAALSLGIGALAAAPPVIAALKVALDLLAANPIVAVTAAVVGLTVAVGTWIAASKEADEGTKTFIESMRASQTAYEELSQTMVSEQETTAATAAALQELLAVEEKSALQKDLIAQKIDELNEAVPELGLAYDSERDSLLGLTEAEVASALERAAAKEEYETQVVRLNELSNEQAAIEARLTEARLALNEAEETGVGNTRELQNNIAELTIAQQENAAKIAELEEASRAYGERQAEIAEKTQEMTSRVEDVSVKMESLQEAYEESYQAAMESIDGQLGLFNELDGSAKTSVDNLIGTLKNQVSYMETYAANIQRAMELGVDEGLVRKLSDGSEESAQILAAIVAGGEEDIAALNAELAKVEEGKASFSQTVAEMETGFNEQMGTLVQDLDKTIQEMDLSDDTYTIGENNIQGLINGTASKQAELVSKYAEMGRAALNAYKREVEQASPSKKFREVGRFDIQGIIDGAEREKEHLAAAYTDAAQSALSAMERNLPSSMEAPSPSAALANQTRQIGGMLAETVNAVGVVGGGEARYTVNLHLHVNGREFYQETIQDLRAVARANPEVTDD